MREQASLTGVRERVCVRERERQRECVCVCVCVCVLFLVDYKDISPVYIRGVATGVPGCAGATHSGSWHT